MAERGLVSVVVPVFNAADYLRQAIDSLESQTYADIEIIAVDDGSTDASPAILASYPSVRVYRTMRDGPSAARNLGGRNANGAFVAFLDADDISERDRIARQVGFLELHPDHDLVCGGVEEFRMGSDGAGRVHVRDVRGLNVLSMCARREVFDRVGWFDQALRHADSIDWFDRAREGGVTMKVLPEIMVYRRLYPESFSSREAAESRREHLRVLKRKLDSRRS